MAPTRCEYRVQAKGARTAARSGTDGNKRLAVKPFTEVDEKWIWGGGGWGPECTGCGRLRLSGHGLCEGRQSR